MNRRDELVPTLNSALRLYVLTDRGLSQGRSDREVVDAALAGGATAIQLRWKTGSLRDALRAGREVRDICRARGALFVVNDRVDLALALEADGVHVGVDDLPVDETRRLVGDGMIVGYSPPTLRDAITAGRLGADYLGVGPIYGTMTKSDAGEPVGVDRVAEIAAAVSIPLVGIGGINAGNAGAIVAAGAAGVAVISAVVAADDPRQATHEILRAVDEAREAR